MGLLAFGQPYWPSAKVRGACGPKKLKISTQIWVVHILPVTCTQNWVLHILPRECKAGSVLLQMLAEWHLRHLNRFLCGKVTICDKIVSHFFTMVVPYFCKADSLVLQLPAEWHLDTWTDFYVVTWQYVIVCLTFFTPVPYFCQVCSLFLKLLAEWHLDAWTDFFLVTWQ